MHINLHHFLGFLAFLIIFGKVLRKSALIRTFSRPTVLVSLGDTLTQKTKGFLAAVIISDIQRSPEASPIEWTNQF
jgi:hypothetical protein